MQLERILYINLETDRERKRRLEAQLRRHFAEVAVERIEAVSPSELPEHVDFFGDRLGDRERPVDGRYPFPGTLACFLSHRRALQTIEENWRQSGCRTGAAYLVLEDDCVFDRTVPRLIADRIDSQLPGGWKAVKHSLGYRRRDDRVNRMLSDLSGARFLNWEYYWGTHFVIYDAAAVAEIIEKTDTLEIGSYDGWLRDNVEGVYTFARRVHIKQSQLGGSNTDPNFRGPEHEDRTRAFGVLDAILRPRRRLRETLYLRAGPQGTEEARGQVGPDRD